MLAFSLLLSGSYALAQDNVRHMANNISQNEIDWLIEQGNQILQDENYSVASEYFMNAQRLSKQNSYNQGIIDSHLGLSKIYANSDYDVSVKHALDALSIAIQIDDKARIYLSYIAIGACHFLYSNYEEAMGYFDMADQIRPQVKDSIDLSIVYHNQALRYLYKNNFAEAINFFNQAIEIMLSEAKYQQAVATMNNLGLVYNNKGSTDSVLLVLNRANVLSDSLSLEKGKISTRINLAVTHLSLNNLDKAHYYVEDAMILAKQSDNLRAIRNCSEIYYQIFKKQANYKEALKYFEDYKTYSDSLMNIGVVQRISMAQIALNDEQYERDLELLRAKSQSRNRLFYIVLSLSTLILVIAVSGIYILSLKNKNLDKENIILAKEKQLQSMEYMKEQAENIRKEIENKQLNEELAAQEKIAKLNAEKHSIEIQHKNNELTSGILHISSKNELLMQMKSRIVDAQKTLPKKYNYVLNSLLNDLKKGIDVDKEWHKFIKHFEEVHTVFINRLKEVNPNLTQSDLRLCAYLYINLSSKEISSVLNISQSAVEKRRQRLREKLNLKKGDNLVEYLTSLG